MNLETYLGLVPSSQSLILYTYVVNTTNMGKLRDTFARTYSFVKLNQYLFFPFVRRAKINTFKF